MLAGRRPAGISCISRQSGRGPEKVSSSRGLGTLLFHLCPLPAGGPVPALSTACQLFTQASRKAAETLGYSWQDRWDETVPRFMAETQRDIAALPLAEDWGEELSRQIQAHERRKEQEP